MALAPAQLRPRAFIAKTSIGVSRSASLCRGLPGLRTVVLMW